MGGCVVATNVGVEQPQGAGGNTWGKGISNQKKKKKKKMRDKELPRIKVSHVWRLVGANTKGPSTPQCLCGGRI